MGHNIVFKVKQVWYKILYLFDCILFPPAKAVLAIWIVCISMAYISNKIWPELGDVIAIIFVGLIFVGASNLIYLLCRKKYFNYKIRITEIYMNRIKKSIEKASPEYYEAHYGVDDKKTQETILSKKENKRDYFIEAGELAVYSGKISEGMVQRHCKVGFTKAMKILKELEDYKVISPNLGGSYRKVLVTRSTFENIVKRRKYQLIAREEGNEMLDNYDEMTGIEFENFCASILMKNGFIGVDTTPASGDHGIDIIAEKDDITYAIQCKCYSANVGNAAIQQVVTGKQFYRKDVAVVMTNQYFTAQAKEEAHAIGVKLWDRDRLNEMIAYAKEQK